MNDHNLGRVVRGQNEIGTNCKGMRCNSSELSGTKSRGAGSTGYIQPQDLSLFRSWRFFHEKIEHYVHINQIEMIISDRQYFIYIHSVIHNQLSAPEFKNLIKNGFIQAQIIKEIIGQIEKPKDVCFKFYDLYCSINNCNERTL